MNAPVSLCVPHDLEQAHALRSVVLDSFADVECAVARVLQLVPKPPSDGACLGQKLELAKTIKPSPQFATTAHASLLLGLNDLTQLLAVRADIVHSRLRLADVDGTPMLIFTNSRVAGDTYPTVRLIKPADMLSLQTQLGAIAKRLDAALRRPSPPQPKPDAAAAP